MATADELNTAYDDTRLFLLGRVKGATTALAALRWAEAYAWITSPANSHGGTDGAS